MAVPDAYTPAFSVIADGADLTAALKVRMIFLSVCDEIQQESGSARGTAHVCDIELDDRDASVVSPPMGSLLTISMGYKETGLVLMGIFRVDEVEFSLMPRRMTIRGRSADTNSPSAMPQVQGRRKESWDPSTIAGIAGVIAARNGWGVKVVGVGGNPTPHLDQAGQSDMDFLKSSVVAQFASDCYCTLAGGKIVIAPMPSATTSADKPKSTYPIPVTQALSCHATFSDRNAHKTVKADHWDVDAGELVTEVATGDGEDSVTQLPGTYHPDAAGFVAASQQQALGRGSAAVSLTVIGDPNIGSGGQAILSGFRPGVDGGWIVTKAEHRMDESGYVTEIDAVKL